MRNYGLNQNIPICRYHFHYRTYTTTTRSQSYDIENLAEISVGLFRKKCLCEEVVRMFIYAVFIIVPMNYSNLELEIFRPNIFNEMKIYSNCIIA